jgi:hypothetical protein
MIEVVLTASEVFWYFGLDTMAKTKFRKESGIGDDVLVSALSLSRMSTTVVSTKCHIT